MSAVVTCDPDKLRAELGDRFLDQLTYPQIFKDAPNSVLPVLVSNGADRTIVIAETDSTALNAAADACAAVTYGRYFTWRDERPKPARPALDFADAVRSVTGPQCLELDGTMPMSRYRMLQNSGPVLLAGTASFPEVRVHVKSRRSIEHRWAENRDKDSERLRGFVAGLRHGSILNAFLERDTPGFEILDSLLAANDIDTILVTSPHEVELFSGAPAELNARLNIWALYPTGSDDILLLSPETPPGATTWEGGATPLPQSIKSLARGTVGTQLHVLSANDWFALQREGIEFVDAAAPIRRWQDLRAGGDLIYYILTANAVLAGIDAARTCLARAGTAERSERQLVSAYFEGVKQFAVAHGFGDRLSRYFDLLHSGARTLLPAAAADFPVSSADKTIKFDMGLSVVDADGCVRAVSDIARTICSDPGLQDIHDRLRVILVDQLIPSIKPGMSGAEIHAKGIDCLRPLEGDLRALGLLPPGQGVEGYRRDCGHALQRTTISSVYFLPSVDSVIEAGMVGCVEYVWPIDDVLIAVEDSFFVTPGGGVPITAQQSQNERMKQ